MRIDSAHKAANDEGSPGRWGFWRISAPSVQGPREASKTCCKPGGFGRRGACVGASYPEGRRRSRAAAARLLRRGAFGDYAHPLRAAVENEESTGTRLNDPRHGAK